MANVLDVANPISTLDYSHTAKEIINDGLIKLTWLNIRGARSKDELLVRTATEQQWPLVLLTETKLKREQEKLFCGMKNEYSWILGAGQKLTRESAPGKGGVGALVHASIRGSIHRLDSTRDQLWLRLDHNTRRSDSHEPNNRPTFIGVVYLPSGSSTNAQAECRRIYEEVALRVQKYQSQGSVLLGGDMNARLSANEDTITNQAGLRLMEFAQRNGLLIGNTQLPPQKGETLPRCIGSFSRCELRRDGLQQSTLDYVLVSKSAQAQLHSLKIDASIPHRVLSDHKPLVVQWRYQPTVAADNTDTVHHDKNFHESTDTPPPRVRWRVDDINADRKVKDRMKRGMDLTMEAWCGDTIKWMESEEYRLASSDDKIATLLGSWEYQLTRSLAETVGAKQVIRSAQSWVSGGNLLQLIRERDELRAQCERAKSSKQQSTRFRSNWKHKGKKVQKSNIAMAATEVTPDLSEVELLHYDKEWKLLALRTLDAQLEVRKEIHRRKKRQREKTFESIEREWSHPKLFYRRVQEMRSDSTASGMSAPVLRDPITGEMESELKKRMEITQHHYATLGTDERLVEQAAEMRRNEDVPVTIKETSDECIQQEENDSTTEEYDRRFAQKIEKRVLEMAEASLLQVDSPLDQPFEEEELKNAMIKLRNGKATGADNIHAEFLRYGGSQLQRALQILFNEILRYEVWPQRWCLGLICPIYKHAGSEADLDNYRPITLLSIVSKLFETLLNTRLMEWAEKNRILCDEQGGFRTKRGCADQLFILKEVWSSRREQKQPTYSAFLDVKSAYDRVWRTGLWYRLFECGVRGKLWRMIRAMYAHMMRVVIVDGQRTDSFSVDVGVSQGSVLSPFLYSVFIDGLICMLKKDDSLGVRMVGEQLVGLLYADDIVLLAPSPEVLQQMLILTSKYAQQWRFHFNGRKSQIVVQGTKQQVADAQKDKEWRLDGHILSLVSEYKYLGMETGLPPNVAPQKSFCTRIIHSATHRAHDILLAGCEMNELDARCSSRLWCTLCRPILEYGSEVWRPNIGQCKQLEQVQGWFARRVLGCHQGTPAVFATSELGIRSLEHRRDQYHLRYWRRLCSALPERLLNRIFRQRVVDVKQLPDEMISSSYSLCRMFQTTLFKYELEQEFDQVMTDQLYAPDEWSTKVNKTVRLHEENMRQIIISQRSSLDTYASSLVPKLGKMAPYLFHNRNREGAWIQCRLRSESLPLMQILARQCHPPREDVHATCPICPHRFESLDDTDNISAIVTPSPVENVTHFLAECTSPEMLTLRHELCVRLRSTIKQQCQELDSELESGPLSGAKEIGELLEAMETRINKQLDPSRQEMESNSIQATATTTTTFRSNTTTYTNALSDIALSKLWSEVILGRRTDRVTGREWNSSLLQSIQSHTQNFLLLAWRARAARIGGVPTLIAGGGGIATIPYQRMKTIGIRHVRIPSHHHHHHHNRTQNHPSNRPLQDHPTVPISLLVQPELALVEP